MKVSGRTIAYAALMTVIVLAVAVLMTKIARTEEGSRRLITVAAVVVAAIVVGGAGAMGLRGLRRSKQGEGEAAGDDSGAQKPASE